MCTLGDDCPFARQAFLSRMEAETERQEDPNRLHLRPSRGPEQILTAGASTDSLTPGTLAVLRLPGGHPEGYFEVFAVLYREFASPLDAWRQGNPNPIPATLSGIEDGMRGMRFTERAIESSRAGAWVGF